MSNPEGVERRLVVLRDLPTLSEKAFRAAARETVLVRPTRPCVETVLRERVRFHLERLVGSGSIGILHLEEARALEQRVGRFVRSALFRRLMALPPARVFLADSAAFDLVVRDGDRDDIAVRFAMPSVYIRVRSDPYAACDSRIATIVMYDPSSGRTKRIDREPLGGPPILEKFVGRAERRSMLSAAA